MIDQDTTLDMLDRILGIYIFPNKQIVNTEYTVSPEVKLWIAVLDQVFSDLRDIGHNKYSKAKDALNALQWIVNDEYSIYLVITALEKRFPHIGSIDLRFFRERILNLASRIVQNSHYDSIVYY